jgi:pimeloyl-ACP methyl ester carboxylesterase
MIASRPQPRFVLRSGAGLPGWVWDGVRARLPGESVVAAYPRPGETTPPEPDASLLRYAEAVLAQAPWPAFTVVAHSSGGVVGTELAALAPHRLEGFLAVSALLPRPGSSFLGSLPFPQGAVVGLAMRLLGTRPPEKALRRGLGGGLAPDVVDRLVAGFSPESPRLFRDRVGVPDFPARRGYVVTTEDPQLPAALQRRLADHLGRPWLAEVPTGHMPMLQDPAGLAELVARFLAQPVEVSPSPSPGEGRA